MESHFLKDDTVDYEVSESGVLKPNTAAAIR